jgi:hypothetical protein
MRRVYGGICVCDSCVYKIIKIHVSVNVIKSLCPYCLGQKVGICNYCDLSVIIKQTGHVE